MNKSLASSVARYQELLEKNENLFLIDELYAEDIQQVENNEEPVIGKVTIRAMEENNLLGVNSLEQKIVTLLIDESTGFVMGEMEIFFDSKKHGPKKLHEAFVQHWKNDQIIYQKFYYKSFIDSNGR